MSRTHPAEHRPPRGARAFTLALSLAAAACSVADARPQPEPAPVAPQPVAPRENPLVGPEFVKGQQTLAGRIEERLVAGSYVYLAIRGQDGATQWAAVLGAAPAVGSDVALVSVGRRSDFHSPRLQRDFPVLHFAVVPEPPASH
ncbi:hypothetical protein [Nannocystis bainbridge]|uniref:Uncharacterized protein n=1 Tax=Nannocystis bainbridge TaxID=2995303 RepID=A0ABT5DS49_9BACT|nr:hypothetical protein [Nannocystis bainbridge]MDC0716470.1 hypothetical protein [Nannocystis bainbridge]